MTEKKYYPIDAYYSYLDKKLFYIVKEVLPDGTVKKITGIKKDPDYTIKLAPFSKKFKYLISEKEVTNELTLKYSQYGRLKKALGKILTGKKVSNAQTLLNKYPVIMAKQVDIYDDYKLETKFLQQEIFSYDDDYINSIDIGIWDIEVFHDDKEFPNPKEAKYTINSISFFNLKTSTFTLFFLRNDAHHAPLDELKEQIYNNIKKEFGDSFNYDVRIYEKEIILLSKFLEFLQDIDVLVGWNSIDFDTVYLYTRCKHLNISTIFQGTFGEMYETMNIVDSKQGVTSFTHYTTKILSLDYIHLIKFYSMKNYPSYSLNRIAEKLLDSNEDMLSSKIEVSNLNLEYLQNPANFALYNIGDVLLNKYIDDKLLFIKLLFKQKTMTRGFGAATLSINNILDSYIALKCKEEGLACISPVKVANFYSYKIWHIYKRLNFLSDERLKLINKLREENKTFSLFATAQELDECKYNIISEFTDNALKEDNKQIRLTKTQIPFIWQQEKYPGAYVKKPKKGIYLNVVDLDASSMYPSSIYTTNNSADTWVYQIPENVALKFLYERNDFIEYVKNNENFFIEVYDVINDSFKKFVYLEVLDLFKLMYDKELVLVETGAVFVPAHIKEGFFRKLIKYPISQRKSVKLEMKHLVEEKGLISSHADVQNLNITQLVLKILANSVYGYLGFRRSRLFNIILATSITMNCQFMIRYVSYFCDDIIQNVKIDDIDKNS